MSLRLTLASSDDEVEGGTRLPRKCLFTLPLKSPRLYEYKRKESVPTLGGANKKSRRIPLRANYWEFDHMRVEPFPASGRPVGKVVGG